MVGAQLLEQPVVVRDGQHAEVRARWSAPRCAWRSRAARRCRGRSRARRGWRSSARSTPSCSVSLRFFSPPERSTLSARSSSAGSNPMRAASASSRAPRSDGRSIPRAAKAWSHRVDELTPGTSVGYCMHEEQPGLGPLPAGHRQQVDAVERDRAAESPRSPGLPMSTCDSVDLPAPFGPITACTSPERTVRSMPLRIVVAGDRGAQVADLEGAHCDLHVDLDHAVDDPATYTGTGLVAGSVCGSPVTRLNVLPCFQHSISLLVAPHLALGERDVGVAAGVADGVDVVADAHDGDCAAVDVEARRAVRAPARRKRADARCSSACADRAWRRPGRAAARPARPTGQLGEHLVEEAEHDEPLGDLGRDAAALEVEALLLVDRPDRAGVAALHVVGLDLEVGHALGPGAVAEREVAVGLEGVRALGLVADPDQPGVDAAAPCPAPRP